MSSYNVTADSINMHAGILVLDPSQAQPRMHRLTALWDDRYEVSSPPVTFKRGEMFDLEGELPKALVQGTEEAEGFSKVEHAEPRMEPGLRRKQK